jgi:hypothetical protein
MQDRLLTTWEQVYDVFFARPSAQDSPEQTRLSWARLVGSYADVPEPYNKFFEPFLAGGQDFPYVVLTPTFKGFIQPKTTEKLICDFGHEIVVLEKKGISFEAQHYPAEGIQCIEVSAILLVSYLQISGVTKNGTPATSLIYFNSVTDYLIMPIVERMRSAAAQLTGVTQDAEGFETFNRWNEVSIKFMNYARRSVLKGDEVLHALLQPEIRKRIFTIFGLTYDRLLSPTHAIILTDRELIIIREDEKQIKDGRYGGIWDYIPVKKIAALSLNRKDNDLLTLSIRLPEHTSLERLFRASAEPEIHQLLERFTELKR